MPKSIIDIKIDKVIQIFLGKNSIKYPAKNDIGKFNKTNKVKNTSEFCTSHIT